MLTRRQILKRLCAAAIAAVAPIPAVVVDEAVSIPPIPQLADVLSSGVYEFRLFKMLRRVEVEWIFDIIPVS